MPRVRDEALALRDLHEAAEIHHGDSVAQVADHREIVGDEQEGETQAALKRLQEVDDLGLDGDVERGHGLVAHDELGLRREGPRDVDALPLPARELVGIAAGECRIQADEPHHLLDAPAAARSIEAPVDVDGLGDDVRHLHAWAQRGEGVLEDHLHAPAQAAHLGGREVAKRGAVEDHLAAGGADEAEDRARERALPAAALADEPDGLAAGDVERYAVDRPQRTHLAPDHGAAQERKGDPQVADTDERGRPEGGVGSAGRRSGRRRSARNDQGNSRRKRSSRPCRTVSSNASPSSRLAGVALDITPLRGTRSWGCGNTA